MHHHAKNQFIPSIHSWDTVNFRVLWPDWPHPFLTTHIQNFFDQLLIHLNLYQHAKKSGYFIDLFWRYGWLKNPAVWLAENILAHISGTRIFPDMGLNFHYRTNSVKIITKFFNIFKKTMFLAHFWSIFPIFLSRTTSYGFLASCQNLEKTNETIPRKHPDRRKDGRTDRPYLIEPFRLMPGVQ